MNQLNQLIELTRSELKRDDRQRIMSLITVDAHARDIVLMLVRENVTDKVRIRASVPVHVLPSFNCLRSSTSFKHVCFLLEVHRNFTNPPI